MLGVFLIISLLTLGLCESPSIIVSFPRSMLDNLKLRLLPNIAQNIKAVQVPSFEVTVATITYKVSDFRLSVSLLHPENFRLLSDYYSGEWNVSGRGLWLYGVGKLQALDQSTQVITMRVVARSTVNAKFQPLKLTGSTHVALLGLKVELLPDDMALKFSEHFTNYNNQMLVYLLKDKLISLVTQQLELDIPDATSKTINTLINSLTLPNTISPQLNVSYDYWSHTFSMEETVRVGLVSRMHQAGDKVDFKYPQWAVPQFEETSVDRAHFYVSDNLLRSLLDEACLLNLAEPPANASQRAVCSLCRKESGIAYGSKNSVFETIVDCQVNKNSPNQCNAILNIVLSLKTQLNVSALYPVVESTKVITNNCNTTNSSSYPNDQLEPYVQESVTVTLAAWKLPLPKIADMEFTNSTVTRKNDYWRVALVPSFPNSTAWK